MDLRTTYLGMELAHPVVPSAAQPLTKDLDCVKRLEDAGAAAVVIHSLFEEQIEAEAGDLAHFLSQGAESTAEALSYFPTSGEYVLGPEEYLEHVRRCRESLSVPVVGSLNGVSVGGWTEYAAGIEQAGADAIELNVYYLPANPDVDSATVEKLYCDLLRAVKERVSIPVAVKLGPFFTALPHFARRLAEAGADGITLFNRYYEPDIDIAELEVCPHLVLSVPEEVFMPLRWIAILRPHLDLTISASTGVHTAEDAVKLVMVGADVVNMCGALLRRGVECLAEVRDGIGTLLEENGYATLEEAKGCMSQARCPEPSAFERATYVKAVHGYVR